MTKQTLQRAKNLEACIQAAQANIDHLNRFKHIKEIMIVDANSDVAEAIKGITYNDTDKIPPIYIAGIKKDDIIELIMNSDYDIKLDAEKQLEKL